MKPNGIGSPSQISPPKNPDDDPERTEMREAAEAMESVFVESLFQAMRDTVPKNECSLDNQASQIYQGMLDTEHAKIASKTHTFGLADQSVAYLESVRYPGVRSTGGTNEGSATRIEPRSQDIRKP